MWFLACAVDAPFESSPIRAEQPSEGGPSLPPLGDDSDEFADAAPDADDAGCPDGGGECTPGETRTGACGRCGTRPETCSAACVWVGGACSDEKLCDPDDYEVESGDIGCPHPRQVRTRTCSSACAWSDWSECVFSGWSRTPSIAPDSLRDVPDATMWTGQELILQSDSCYGGSIHAYNPANDALRDVVDPLPATEKSLWTWTGTRAFVFSGSRCEGGVEQDGALIDVETGVVDPVTGPGGLTTAPLLGAWVPSTGDVLILSGPSWNGPQAPPYAFRPSTRSWRALPASAVKEPKHALWTGTRLLVTGFCGDWPLSQCVDAWDPTTETWTPLSLPNALTGVGPYISQAMTPLSTSIGIVFWGAYDNALSATVGGILDEATGQWTIIKAPAPAVLNNGIHSAFWAKDKLWVWTGGTLGPGATWDPATKTWSSMPLGGPSDGSMPARPTGTDVIFWGGPNAGSRGWVFHP